MPSYGVDEFFFPRFFSLLFSLCPESVSDCCGLSLPFLWLGQQKSSLGVLLSPVVVFLSFALVVDFCGGVQLPISH